jgi:hypothetical protein
MSLEWQVYLKLTDNSYSTPSCFCRSPQITVQVIPKIQHLVPTPTMIKIYRPMIEPITSINMLASCFARITGILLHLWLRSTLNKLNRASSLILWWWELNWLRILAPLYLRPLPFCNVKEVFEAAMIVNAVGSKRINSWKCQHILLHIVVPTNQLSKHLFSIISFFAL